MSKSNEFKRALNMSDIAINIFNKNDKSRLFENKIEMTKEQKKKFGLNANDNGYFDELVLINPSFKNSKLVKIEVSRTISY